MINGSVRQNRALDDGATLAPYFSALMIQETTEAFAFTISGSSPEATTEISRAALGLEYLTPYVPGRGAFVVRAEVAQIYGLEPMTLSNNSVYTPNADPVGSLTLGWYGLATDTTSARAELTVGELGNDDNSEVRLDTTWERLF